MTYRELLKLYQEGKLDKAQTDEVEHAIEKQEAISEYLYEKEEIPGLEVLQGQEKEEVFVQGNDAESEEEQRFVKMIQKTIRRTFLKMGAIVGAGVLAIVLCVIFVLPQVVSAFYYNPNEVVGIGEGSDNITTTRMSLDLSVYSELFCRAVTGTQSMRWQMVMEHTIFLFRREFHMMGNLQPSTAG